MEPKSSWQPGPAVCRCCLTEGCYKDISSEYFWMGKREVYADMLSETLDVNISYTPSGGRLICESCISRLRDATEFKKQVQDCEKTFIQLLQPNTSGIASINEPGASKPLKAEIELKLEKLDDSDDDFPDMSHPFDDDDDDDELDMPLKNFATKVPKEEPDTEILDLLNRPGITAKRISTSKAKASPAKKAKVQVKAKDKPSSSKPTVKVVAKNTTKKTVDKAVKDEKKKKDTAAMVNAKLIISNSTALPITIGDRTSIKCFLCNCKFDDFSQFRKHMNEQHTSEDRARAVGKYVTTRVDIHDLKCKHCDKPADSIETLATHLNEEHGFYIDTQNIDLVPINLIKGLYECLYCKQKFVGLLALVVHSGTHLTKHICNVCGENFGTLTRLNVHFRKYHSDKKRYCVVCKLGFESLQALQDHRITNADCAPYKCQLCKEKFSTHGAKRQHIKKKHGDKNVSYPCFECDKIFDSRNRFYVHYKKVHTQNLKCKYCDKVFGRRAVLSTHLYIHTGERPYKCTKCNKGYGSKWNLKRHMTVYHNVTF